MDIIPWLLRTFPRLPFRGRMLGRWLASRRLGDLRTATLPGGARLPCDLGQPYEAMVWLGAEEADELRALAALLRPGDVFVDVGACLGLWTLCAARCVAPGGRVHAFEPNPTTAGRLRKNVAQNYADSVVEVHAHALGAGEGEATLEIGLSPNLSRLAPGGSCRVPVRALDTCLSPDAAVRGLKVDVEGGESEVLRGAARMLQTHRPWVCAEFTSGGRVPLGEWPVLALLGSGGWRPFLAPAAPHRPWQPLPADWRVPSYANVFFIPADFALPPVT